MLLTIHVLSVSNISLCLIKFHRPEEATSMRRIFAFAPVVALILWGAIFILSAASNRQPPMDAQFTTNQSLKAWQQIPDPDLGSSFAPETCDVYSSRTVKVLPNQFGDYWQRVISFPFREDWISVREVNGTCAGWVQFRFLKQIDP